jgi:hypothetical protein
MNDLIFLREELYSLKREYGFPLDVYRLSTGETDYKTGEKSDSRTKYAIDRAIVLPVKYETQVYYTTAFLKASREFALGGYQDQEIKRIIIDSEDLPIDFVLRPDDFLVYDHSKFEVVYLEKLEVNSGYQLIARRLVGAPVNEIHILSVRDDIRILDSTQGVLDD